MSPQDIAYHAINIPEIVKKAFYLCAAPGTDFNLLHKSLTSHATRQAILDLHSTNSGVYVEMISGIQALLHIPAISVTAGEQATDDNAGHTLRRCMPIS
ncbi:hypothetical protein BDV93DRAFT_565291 [Ceratobasidium sp. AG-I]|nr:hypothetical protein BDV93DRAFT_565291 [Ceratobasidium sp. AG-I]